MEHIGGLTKKRNVLAGVAEATLVCNLAQKTIKNIFPKSRPIDQISFSSGRLRVGASGASFAQELRLLEGKITASINEKLGEVRVQKITIRVL